MVAGASGSSRRSSRASATTPSAASAGYADSSLGTGLAPKSRARARAHALTQPPLVPVAQEVPEETSTVEVEICVAGQPAPEATRVQILPTWALVADPEAVPFRQEVVDNYRRIVGSFIQIVELHSLYLRLGEYFDHIQQREIAFWTEEENNGDAGRSSGAGHSAGRGQ